MRPNAYAKFVRTVAHLPYFKGKSRLTQFLSKWIHLPTQELGTDFPYGFKMNLNPESPWEISYYTHDKELDTMKFLKEVLKPGHCFWDIGANIGFYSLLSSKLIGNTGQTYSFEPTPNTFKRLSEHVRINQIKNIMPLQFVLGEKPGSAQIVEPNIHNHGMNFFKNQTVQSNGFKVDSIDNFIEHQKLRAPHVMKIDVEGAELMVLKGAQNLLRHNPPSMVIEISETNLKRFGHSTEELLDHLFSCHDFAMYFDHRGKRHRVENRKKLPHTLIFGEDHGYNYMFYPK